MGRIAGAGLLVFVALIVLTGSAAAAPTWLPEQEPFGDAESRLVTATMAPDGTVTVVRVGPIGELEARTRPPGGTFESPEQIETGWIVLSPVLVAARNGGVAIVYSKDGKVWGAIRSPGGRFGEPRVISNLPLLPTPEQVVLEESGRIWFVHEESTFSLPSIVASTLGPSGPATDIKVQTAPALNITLSSPTVGLSTGGKVQVGYAVGIFAGPGGPICAFTSEVREAEGGVSGFPNPTTLDREEAIGSGSPNCVLNSGSTLNGPRIASGGDGSTTVLFSRNSVSGSAPATFLARYRPPGGSWPSAVFQPETVGTAAVKGSAEGFVTNGGSTPFAAIYTSVAPNFVSVTSRNADGTWTVPQTVTGVGGGITPQIASSRSGAAIVSFREFASPYRMLAVVRSPSGTLSGAPVSGAGDSLIPGGVGIDDQGNAVVSWADEIGTEPTTRFRAWIAGYDGAGPRFTSLNMASSGLVGQPLDFSASAVDVWSAAGPPSWQFGDGGGASGGAVSHTYAGAGSYDASVAATDGFGNTTTENRQVTVSAPDLVKDESPPAMTKVSLKPKKVRRGKAAKLNFTLSEPATVRATVARVVAGVKRGRACVKSQPQGKAKGRSCRRLITVKSLSGGFAAGASSLTLPKSLAVGSYEVTALATDGAGNASAPRSMILRVVKRSG